MGDGGGGLGGGVKGCLDARSGLSIREREKGLKIYLDISRGREEAEDGIQKEV